MSNYTCVRKFSKNILVLGQRGCGKTRFLQNLARNIMLGKLKKVNWISKIKLSKKQDSYYPGDIFDLKLIQNKIIKRITTTTVIMTTTM